MNKQLYPFKDFVVDYDFICPKVHAQESPSFEGGLAIVWEYMQERYSDSDASFRLQRFMLIMMYVSHNYAAFDRGDYFVYGSERVGSLASQHLLRAIHHFFTKSEALAGMADPSPEEVMALADQMRDPRVETE